MCLTGQPSTLRSESMKFEANNFFITIFLDIYSIFIEQLAFKQVLDRIVDNFNPQISWTYYV
jgi:hypothetical protein